MEHPKRLKSCPLCKHTLMKAWLSEGDVGGPETDGWYIFHGWDDETQTHDCPLQFGPVDSKDAAITRWNSLPRIVET